MARAISGYIWPELYHAVPDIVPCCFSGGRTLQILNAQEDDAGRYACVATNEAGEMIKHYEVKVYSKF